MACDPSAPGDHAVDAVVLCAGSSASEGEKTVESLSLTVEQVRRAADVWIAACDLPRSMREQAYRRAAERIAYYQHRNQQARLSHTRKTIRRLRELGIEPDQLKSCLPRDP